MGEVVFKTNFTNCILDAFLKRGYRKTLQEDWHIIWKEKEHVAQLYDKRLSPTQRINHFQNYFQLCRKDNLIRNLKKHKRALEKEGKGIEAATYDFFPPTYVLPSEYVPFSEEFKKHPTWIMKPTGKSQGKGIFLFNRLQQVAGWEQPSAQPYIVQRYISDPLLIGGKKFDLRLYALVLSFTPLTAYFYREGFARFTHRRYDQHRIEEPEIHLTNVAVQKHSHAYDQVKGGKWSLTRLKLYLISKHGAESINQCFLQIQQLVLKTFLSVAKIMGKQVQSFQLYGFDVLLDARLTPWLLEVNGSPSMTGSTQHDKAFKRDLLDDVLTLVDVEKKLNGNEEQVGNFDLMKKRERSLLGTELNRAANLKHIFKAKKTATSLVSTTFKPLQNSNRPHTNIKNKFVIKKGRRQNTNEN